MNLSTETPKGDWDGDDAAKLKDFLTSDVGRKALLFVADVCPDLLDGEDVNKTLVRNGEVKGFNLAVNTLFSLVNHKPTPVEELTSEYPPLDDDAAWKEIDKLTHE